MLNFGQKIKKLRNQKNVSQEVLASYLGVTSQAVSKWERNETYPDITLLSSIAIFFNTTTDYLLGVDATEHEQEISAIIEKSTAHFSKGELKLTEKTLKQGLEKHPYSHKLMLEMIHLRSMMPYKCASEKESQFETSVSELYMILEESTDSLVRNAATAQLIRHLTYLKRNNEAVKIAATCTEMNSSSTILNCDLTTGDERLQNIRKAILLTVEELNGLLSRLGDYNEENGYSLEEKIAIRELSIQVNEKVLGEEAVVSFGWHFWKRCETVARGYALLGDSDKSLYWLEKAKDIALKHDSLPENYVFSGLLLKGLTYNSKKTKRNYSCSEYNHFKEQINDEVYSKLNKNERFTKL